MKPVSPQNYKGIIFVQLNMLPEGQRQQFKEWLPETCKIKIQTDSYILRECVAYSDYSFWYSNFYKENGLLENQI